MQLRGRMLPVVLLVLITLAILLVIVLVFYWMYNKLLGVDKLKFG